MRETVISRKIFKFSLACDERCDCGRQLGSKASDGTKEEEKGDKGSCCLHTNQDARQQKSICRISCVLL